MCIEGKGSVWKESAVYERKWMCMKGRTKEKGKCKEGKIMVRKEREEYRRKGRICIVQDVMERKEV